jgi:hypothetical protein
LTEGSTALFHSLPSRLLGSQVRFPCTCHHIETPDIAILFRASESSALP